MDDADAEADDEEVADVVDITEEIDDGNGDGDGDGEGAIEEGERDFIQAEQPRAALQSSKSPFIRLANCSTFPVLGSRVWSWKRGMWPEPCRRIVCSACFWRIIRPSSHGTRINIHGRLVPMDVDPPFDATGLKEIGNLASWTVSTYKPGCGVEALRDEDTNLFWQ
jgi:hypothetical protein